MAVCTNGNMKEVKTDIMPPTEDKNLPANKGKVKRMPVFMVENSPAKMADLSKPLCSADIQ